MTTPRPRRRLLGALIATVVAAGTGMVAAAPPAEAANLGNFDPGYIISDAVFYDATTMNADQIQAFLVSNGSGCVRGGDGSPCLKDYRETTVTRDATARCSAPYVGADNESAATILAKVAAACGINPQVLIVTLQKEQGLVTTTTPTSTRYRSAMGYGCPDSSVCDAQYYGFFNQVYSAASQLKNYALNPASYTHRAGAWNTIGYYPASKPECGSSQVYIQNQATAGLYNYTPYQPNAAALAAGYGTGDGCSSYGNRNFWNYFTDWFGPTTQRVSIGSIEAVGAAWNGISITGWALDPDSTGPIQVHVYVDGQATLAAQADGYRPDVGSAYKKGDYHGYALAVPARAGTHSVCVYAIDSVAGGPNPQLGCRTVTVPSATVLGSLDSVVGGTDALTVNGWAFDPDTIDPVQVHVYVDGAAAYGAVANSLRTDVGAVYPYGDYHGYSWTLPATPGTHTVCAYGIDANGGANPQLGCRTVNVTSSTVNHAPLATLDTVTTSTGAITVAGWALDPDTIDPIQVHVYVDGAAAYGAVANGLRTDVGAVHGKGDNHGFAWTFAAGPGRHTVCAYAIDATLRGPNPQFGCRTVTVPTVVNQTPIGSIDVVSASTGAITVAGWALDPDTTDPIQAHVYVDGAAVYGAVADGLRTDVGAAYGKGDNHGYTWAFPATPGAHTVCVYAIDASLRGPNPQLGCRTVTVPTVVNQTPIGSLDVVSASAGALTVAGWALDPDTTDPIQVHVYVDGAAVYGAVANGLRTDVGAAYGKGDYHGFGWTFAAGPGTHTVCAYAIDATLRGPNPKFGCRTVTVP